MALKIEKNHAVSIEEVKSMIANLKAAQDKCARIAAMIGSGDGTIMLSNNGEKPQRVKLAVTDPEKIKKSVEDVGEQIKVSVTSLENGILEVLSNSMENIA